MSNVATYQTSCASTAVAMNTDSVTNEGEVKYYFIIVSCCFMSSAHAHTFVSPLIFLKLTPVMTPPRISVFVSLIAYTEIFFLRHAVL